MTTRPGAVLLVDDSASSTYAMRRVLEPLGAVVHEAHSGRDALAQMLHQRFAVVVLDVRMPEISGFELAQLMRGHEQTRGIPIIFVSGESTAPDDVFQGYDAGAVDYLTKPVHPEILRSKVAVFIELDRQTRELAVMDELRRTQAQLESATRDLSSFARAASHDLREPARTVRILAASLARRPREPTDPEAAQELHEIEQLGSRMLGMLEALGSYAELATETTWSRTNLTQLACGVAAELKSEFREAGTELELEPLPRVYGHPQQLEELFRHLIRNALCYRRGGVPLRVVMRSRMLDVDEILKRGLDPARRHVCVTIEDNGRGISREHRETIFHPFAHLQSRDEIEGAHMGLAICRRIVERHGGRIELESEPGTGTTFGIVLPSGEPASRLGGSAPIDPEGDAYG